MPQAIRDLLPPHAANRCPRAKGRSFARALESLALRYRMVLGWLEELVGGRIETIHIVGGGTQNRQLCQMAADACNRRVVAGPVEATAIGNVMMQAVAAGDVAAIAEAREVIRRASPSKRTRRSKRPRGMKRMGGSKNCCSAADVLLVEH